MHRVAPLALAAAVAVAAGLAPVAPARGAIPPRKAPQPAVCPGERWNDAATPPRRIGTNGPAGLRVFDVREAPEPGYDWRALASVYLPGFAPDAPLPPALREQARANRRESGAAELAFAIPPGEVRGVYHALSLDQFRPLPKASLEGRLSVELDPEGCENGTRSYTGAMLSNEPAAAERRDWIGGWFPKAVTWSDQRAVPIGPGGFGPAGAGFTLALPMGGDARFPERHPESYVLSGARLGTLEPSGAVLLLVRWSGYGREGFWAFQVRKSELVKVGEVSRPIEP